jgi:hypothetical protein
MGPKSSRQRDWQITKPNIRSHIQTLFYTDLAHFCITRAGSSSRGQFIFTLAQFRGHVVFIVQGIFDTGFTVVGSISQRTGSALVNQSGGEYPILLDFFNIPLLQSLNMLKAVICANNFLLKQLRLGVTSTI